MIMQNVLLSYNGSKIGKLNSCANLLIEFWSRPGLEKYQNQREISKMDDWTDSKIIIIRLNFWWRISATKLLAKNHLRLVRLDFYPGLDCFTEINLNKKLDFNLSKIDEREIAYQVH